jgi:hypothetical protein
MKKSVFLPVILLLLCFSAAAQTGKAGNGNKEKPGEDPFVVKEKPFVVFDEGVSLAWIHRVEKQSGRSTFVFRDFLPGLYVEARTVKMQPLNSMLRLALYYPTVFRFNGMRQFPVQKLRAAVDLFGGVNFNLNMWNYVRINLSPGIHFLYQYGDDWNYVHLGGGGLGGVEFPLSSKWTIFLNGIATLDYGNLGSNRYLEPFDAVWQYQLDFGVRYSKRFPNQYPYLGR